MARFPTDIGSHQDDSEIVVWHSVDAALLLIDYFHKAPPGTWGFDIAGEVDILVDPGMVSSAGPGMLMDGGLVVECPDTVDLLAGSLAVVLDMVQAVDHEGWVSGTDRVAQLLGCHGSQLVHSICQPEL